MSQWYTAHKRDDTIGETETRKYQITGMDDQIPGVDEQIPAVDDQITGVDDNHIIIMDDKIPEIVGIETTEK